VYQTAVVDHRNDAMVDLEAIRDEAAADREASVTDSVRPIWQPPGSLNP
jgi:hypothetical protein